MCHINLRHIVKLFIDCVTFYNYFFIEPQITSQLALWLTRRKKRKPALCSNEEKGFKIGYTNKILGANLNNVWNLTGKEEIGFPVRPNQYVQLQWPVRWWGWDKTNTHTHLRTCTHSHMRERERERESAYTIIFFRNILCKKCNNLETSQRIFGANYLMHSRHLISFEYFFCKI